MINAHRKHRNVCEWRLWILKGKTWKIMKVNKQICIVLHQGFQFVHVSQSTSKQRSTAIWNSQRLSGSTYKLATLPVAKKTWSDLPDFADHFAVTKDSWNFSSSTAQGGFLVPLLVPADSDSSSAWFKIKMSEQRSWIRPRDPHTWWTQRHTRWLLLQADNFCHRVFWGRPIDTEGNDRECRIANRTHESDTSVTVSFPPELIESCRLITSVLHQRKRQPTTSHHMFIWVTSLGSDISIYICYSHITDVLLKYVEVMWAQTSWCIQVVSLWRCWIWKHLQHKAKRGQDPNRCKTSTVEMSLNSCWWPEHPLTSLCADLLLASLHQGL